MGAIPREHHDGVAPYGTAAIKAHVPATFVTLGESARRTVAKEEKQAVIACPRPTFDAGIQVMVEAMADLPPGT